MCGVLAGVGSGSGVRGVGRGHVGGRPGHTVGDGGEHDGGADEGGGRGHLVEPDPRPGRAAHGLDGREQADLGGWGVPGGGRHAEPGGGAEQAAHGEGGQQGVAVEG